MATKHAGMGAALVVLALVFGLMVIVGVILVMMWFQPGIEHSPAEHGSLHGYFASPTAPLPHLPMLREFDLDTGVNT